MVVAVNAQEPLISAQSEENDLLVAVKKRLARPATALIAMSSIQSVFVVIVLVSAIAMRIRGDAVHPSVLYGNAIQGVCLVVIAIGAAKMGYLESIAMGRVAAFMACIPFVTPFTVVGIPFGIWAMRLLKQPDVLAAFESAACLRRQAEPSNAADSR